MSDWNQTVVFGTGRQRGAGVTGFHRQGNQGVFSGFVYRGDTRAPEDTWWSTGLFKVGFELQAAGVNVSGRVTSDIAQVNEKAGTTRGVVSASTSLSMAAYWAVHNAREEGWVYCSYIENERWAADASSNLMGTEGRGAADVQQEVMFKSLPGSRIYAARKARMLGGAGAKQMHLVGSPVANKGYNGRPDTYAIGFNDPGFNLFFAAGDVQV